MTKTILIVEDNDLNMKLFVDVLEGAGYRVLQSGEGVAGFQLARAERPFPASR
jgi:two-component system cell cycle response regulator DivK